MAYSTGLLNKRVSIYNRTAQTTNEYGIDASGVSYHLDAIVWASVTFTKGVKAMQEGAIDAYDYIMVRMRYNDYITRDSIISYKSKFWKIDSFYDEYEENTIQITASERVTDITIEE